MYLKRCINFEEFATLDEEIICCTKTNTVEPKCQHCNEWDLVDLSEQTKEINHGQ